MKRISLIDFIKLSQNQKKMILNWRNSDSIRKWMYSNKPIELTSHFEFIEKLKNDKFNKYFLVQEEAINVGVIYFINIDSSLEECEFGIYAKPNSKGFGKILIKSTINYAFNHLKIRRLIAEVLVENNIAINLYTKFGFKQVVKKLVDTREVFVMELINENR